MATGGTDHMIRVYYLGAETPMKVSEMDAHTVRDKTAVAASFLLCSIFNLFNQGIDNLSTCFFLSVFRIKL